MTDSHSTRSPRRTEARTIPKGIVVLGIILIAGLGYIAGAFNTQIFAAIAPAFGAKVSTDTLDLSGVQSVYQTLKANYDGDIDDSALIEGAKRGVVEAAGDDYTMYMNAAETEEFNNSLTGNIGGGIGVEMGLRNDVVTVVRVLENNPASEVGVLAGDVIVAVNDESVVGQNTDEVVTKIRGEVGTTVKVTVARDSKPVDFTITRKEITSPSVYSSVRDGIGILTISRFDGETGALARAEAQSLKSQGVKGVVLDLRNNGGGYVTAAQEVAGIWLDNQVVVTERQGDRVIDELRSGSRPILNGIPTIVLTNPSTASASEIVAGALRDYKVASLLGEVTFGKGSVQQIIELPDAATLRVTIARWYTPEGQNISKEGLKPDVEVERTLDDVNANRDPQLDAALERL